VTDTTPASVSTPPLLADAEALAARVGLDEDDTRLTTALQNASGRMRGALGFEVTRVDDQVVEIPTRGGRLLFLPSAPVHSLELRIHGALLVRRVDYSLDMRNGKLQLKPGRAPFPDELDAVEITYSHGYDTVPGDIAAAVFEAAETQINTDAGVSSTTVLGDTQSYGGAAVGSTQQWVDVIAHHGRKNLG
jgi:hypothetical protein